MTNRGRETKKASRQAKKAGRQACRKLVL